LRRLHECPTDGCPVPDHTTEYLARAAKNYRAGNYDSSHFPDNWGYASAEEAWAVLEKNGHLLERNTLLHGDYCLPNLIYDGWEFCKFIDVDSGGIGDRHVDLFWGAWTLFFNLHTDAYRDRFFDAYGRDRVDEEKLRIVAAAEVFG
jgi:kanamycin kinase